MGDGDGVSGGSTPPVTMDDLKSLETSLKSSMDAQMGELRAMMRELMKANMPPTTSSLEANASAAHVGEGEQRTNESPPKVDGGRPGYNAVPFAYSADLPMPHYHINNRGDPPKLNPSCFANWQFMMKSHVKGSCSELWRIIEVGFLLSYTRTFKHAFLSRRPPPSL